MQTFFPYPNFLDSAKCLDNKRLGKQRVEVYQILRARGGFTLGWRNHPAVKMWRGAEYGLALYGVTCCTVWLSKGFKDTLQSKIMELGDLFKRSEIYPPWWGSSAFHASHRSNLLRKLPEHYSQFGWIEPNDLPYVWPVK